MAKQLKNNKVVNAQRRSPSLKTEVQPETGAKFYERPFFLVMTIVVITAIAYIPSLKGTFMDTWDDGFYITNNPMIRELNIHSVKAMFTTPVNSSYVPLPLLTYAIEYKLFGYNPLPFHITNLILHILCTLLVFQLFRLMKLNIFYAALAALLSGVHPMRVESVAWITERKDLLYSLFYLGAMIMYIKFITQKEHRSVNFIFSLLLFIFSLLSKIQAVTLPLCLLVLDYYFERPFRFRLIIEKLPFFILSLVFGIIGLIVLSKGGALKPNEVLSLGDRIFYGLYALSTYIVKFIAPFYQCASYSYPVMPGQPLPLLYYLNPVILILLAFLVFRTIHYTRVILTGTLFFLFTIIFMLQILSAGTAYLADRFTNIPYTGLFFIAGWGIQQIIETKKRKTVVLPVLSLVILLFSVLTFNRCKIWENGETLWTDVINKYPGLFVPYMNRGSYYELIEQSDKALKDYDEAARLNPKEITCYLSLGTLKMEMKDYKGAKSDYYKAIALDPKNEIAYQNLGMVYYQEKDFDSAIELSLKELHHVPGNPAIYANLGYYYLEKDASLNAIENFRKCLKKDGNNLDANLGLALSYYYKNDRITAGQYLEKAKKIEPKLKKGMAGIAELEKAGYSYSDKQKETLRKMFEEMK
jgi:Tfp pilus assembly protein PilF